MHVVLQCDADDACHTCRRSAAMPSYKGIIRHQAINRLLKCILRWSRRPRHLVGALRATSDFICAMKVCAQELLADEQPEGVIIGILILGFI